MESIVQGEDEAIGTYHGRLINGWRTAYAHLFADGQDPTTNFQVKKQFLNGIWDLEVQRQVRLLNPASTILARDAANNITAALKAQRLQEKKISPGAASKRMSQMAQVMASVREKTSRTSRAKGTSEGSRLQGDGCFNCGRKNHWQAECRSPCGHCGRAGHKKLDCRSRKAAAAQGGASARSSSGPASRGRKRTMHAVTRINNGSTGPRSSSAPARRPENGWVASVAAMEELEPMEEAQNQTEEGQNAATSTDPAGNA